MASTLPKIELYEEVCNLKHGVKRVSAGTHVKGVFGCHLFKGNLRYGFVYPNGTTVRIAYMCEDEVRTGTIITGSWIIIFTDVKAKGRIKDVTLQELKQPWFDEGAQKLVREQLVIFKDLRDELADMLEGLYI